MKKLILAVSLLLFSASVLLAQAPYRLSYQTVVRNSGGALIANAAVGIKISILQGNTPVYIERHSVTTNANGLASLIIGSGTVITGNISTMNWAFTNPYSLRTEIDPNGGTSYSITANSPFSSVPYALNGVKRHPNGGGGILEAEDPNHSIYLRVGKDGQVDNLDLCEYGNIRFFTGGELASQPERMRITAAGRVGIGITSPQFKLDVSGGIAVRSTDNVGIRLYDNGNGANSWYEGVRSTDGFKFHGYGLAYRGEWNATNGNYSSVSDRRLKKDITVMTDVIARVMKLNPCTYLMKEQKEDGVRNYGFIAQELKEIFPEFVHYNVENDIHTVDYTSLTVVAIKAIKEQQVQLAELKKQNEQLINTLQTQLKEMELKIQDLTKKTTH